MVAENNAVFSKPLTLGAVAQIQDQTDFIATKAFPIVLANSKTGTYKYWDVKDLQRLEAELRKPGSKFKRVNLDVEEKSYNCQNFGLEVGIADETAGELGGNPMQIQADYLMNQGLITLEQNMFTSFLTEGGSVWENEATPTNKWNTTAGDPISDFRNAAVAVAKAGGKRPNSCVMSEDVFEALLQNDVILDRLSTASLRVLTQEQQLAQILGIQNVYVSRGYAVTGNEDASSEAAASLGTEKCLIYYKSDMAPTQNPNAGLVIVRNYAGDVVGANGMGITSPYFDNTTRENIIQLLLRFDMVVPAKTLGYLFYNVLA